MESSVRIEYRTELPEKEQFFTLFETTGWNAGYNLSADDLALALSRSWYQVAAYDTATNTLVGFGRVISDGVYHALITEMIIAPAYQGQHIGSTILKQLVARCREARIPAIQLFAAKGKAPFYHKHGFVDRPADAPGMQFKAE